MLIINYRFIKQRARISLTVIVKLFFTSTSSKEHHLHFDSKGIFPGSLTPDMDEEKRRFIERGSHKGKGIAVFTSGGDSQGMYYTK